MFQVTHLRIEGQKHPLDLQTLTPSLSWWLEGDEAGLYTRQWQLRVRQLSAAGREEKQMESPWLPADGGLCQTWPSGMQLQADHYYQIQVRVNCSAGISPWSAPLAFATLCLRTSSCCWEIKGRRILCLDEPLPLAEAFLTAEEGLAQIHLHLASEGACVPFLFNPQSDEKRWLRGVYAGQGLAGLPQTEIIDLTGEAASCVLEAADEAWYLAFLCGEGELDLTRLRAALHFIDHQGQETFMELKDRVSSWAYPLEQSWHEARQAAKAAEGRLCPPLHSAAQIVPHETPEDQRLCLRPLPAIGGQEALPVLAVTACPGAFCRLDFRLLLHATLVYEAEPGCSLPERVELYPEDEEGQIGQAFILDEQSQGLLPAQLGRFRYLRILKPISKACLSLLCKNLRARVLHRDLRAISSFHCSDPGLTQLRAQAYRQTMRCLVDWPHRDALPKGERPYLETLFGPAEGDRMATCLEENALLAQSACSLLDAMPYYLACWQRLLTVASWDTSELVMRTYPYIWAHFLLSLGLLELGEGAVEDLRLGLEVGEELEAIGTLPDRSRARFWRIQNKIAALEGRKAPSAPVSWADYEGATGPDLLIYLTSLCATGHKSTDLGHDKRSQRRFMEAIGRLWQAWSKARGGAENRQIQKQQEAAFWVSWSDWDLLDLLDFLGQGLDRLQGAHFAEGQSGLGDNDAALTPLEQQKSAAQAYGLGSEEILQGLMLSILDSRANSFFASFVERRIAGLQPVLSPEGEGWRLFCVHPELGLGITWSDYDRETPYGRLRCHWEYQKTEEEEQYQVILQVPADCRAAVFLPWQRRYVWAEAGLSTWSDHRAL